jgi:O-antigen/teichoic acid export membrane protein
VAIAAAIRIEGSRIGVDSTIWRPLAKMGLGGRDKMPKAVRISAWLLCVTYVAGFAVAFFSAGPLPRFPGDSDHYVWVSAVAGGAILALLVAGTFLFILQAMTRGKNWARFVLLVLLALQAFYVWRLPGNFAGISGTPHWDAAVWSVQSVAVLLLFVPTSNRWFRSLRERQE